MNEEMINTLIERMTQQISQLNNNLLMTQIALETAEKELKTLKEGDEEVSGDELTDSVS